MSDGHQISISFDMLGDIPAIEERLKVLVGFCHDLNARNVHAIIDQRQTLPALGYLDRVARIKSDLKALIDGYNRVQTLDLLTPSEEIHDRAFILYSNVRQDIRILRAKCADPATAGPALCANCPNLMDMPDGGVMCTITRRSKTGVF